MRRYVPWLSVVGGVGVLGGLIAGWLERKAIVDPATEWPTVTATVRLVIGTEPPRPWGNLGRAVLLGAMAWLYLHFARPIRPPS